MSIEAKTSGQNELKFSEGTPVENIHIQAESHLVTPLPGRRKERMGGKTSSGRASPTMPISKSPFLAFPQGRGVTRWDSA